MPRSSRRSAPAARSAPRTQTRSASSTTHPSQPRNATTSTAPPRQSAMTPVPPAAIGQPQSRQPGLFSQMASTAAGVAVGSAVGHSIGHGMSGLFSGGGQPEQAEPMSQSSPQYEAAPVQTANNHSCEADLKAFTNCLEVNNNDISACQYYFDMLKQCQAFASNHV